MSLQYLISRVHCVVDIQKESIACGLGSRCKNQGRLEVVLHSRRSLWTRRFSQGGPSLLHFARRHPFISTTGASSGPNSADESLSLADLFGPSESLVVAAPKAVTQIEIASYNTTGFAPSQAPATGESAFLERVCATYALNYLS